MLAISTPPIFMLIFVPLIRFLFLSVMLQVIVIFDPLLVVIVVLVSVMNW